MAVAAPPAVAPLAPAAAAARMGVAICVVGVPPTATAIGTATGAAAGVAPARGGAVVAVSIAAKRPCSDAAVPARSVAVMTARRRPPKGDCRSGSAPAAAATSMPGCDRLSTPPFMMDMDMSGSRLVDAVMGTADGPMPRLVRVVGRGGTGTYMVDGGVFSSARPRACPPRLGRPTLMGTAIATGAGGGAGTAAAAGLRTGVVAPAVLVPAAGGGAAPPAATAAAAARAIAAMLLERLGAGTAGADVDASRLAAAAAVVAAAAAARHCHNAAAAARFRRACSTRKSLRTAYRRRSRCAPLTVNAPPATARVAVPPSIAGGGLARWRRVGGEGGRGRVREREEERKRQVGGVLIQL